MMTVEREMLGRELRMVKPVEGLLKSVENFRSSQSASDDTSRLIVILPVPSGGRFQWNPPGVGAPPP